MTFLRDLRGVVRPETASPIRSEDVSPSNPLFVYVRMPGDLDPFDREYDFAEPLRDVLEKAGLGTVTGGGSCFFPPEHEGEDDVEFCGLDVDLYNVAEGLEVLRRELMRLKAPPGTSLLYELDGRELEEPIYRPAI